MTLLSASSAALAHPKYDQILAPECPRPFQNGTNDLQETFVDILGVYPNPAQSSLNVHFITGSNNQHIVKITDLKGKVLKSVVKQVSPFNSNIALIDVEELSDGVYLLVISDEKGNENKTLFVKE
jgi:hypothetical protein